MIVVMGGVEKMEVMEGMLVTIRKKNSLIMLIQLIVRLAADYECLEKRWMESKIAACRNLLMGVYLKCGVSLSLRFLAKRTAKCMSIRVLMYVLGMAFPFLSGMIFPSYGFNQVLFADRARLYPSIALDLRSLMRYVLHQVTRWGGVILVE